jgi:hypothetical protein
VKLAQMSVRELVHGKHAMTRLGFTDEENKPWINYFLLGIQQSSVCITHGDDKANKQYINLAGLA